MNTPPDPASADGANATAGSPRPHPLKVRIKVLHATVKGRARYHVSTLQRSETFAVQLQRQLSALEGIVSARPSALTGNVLLHYDPVLTPEAVLALLKKGIRRALTGARYTRATASPAAGRDWQGFKRQVNRLLDSLSSLHDARTTAEEAEAEAGAPTPATPASDWYHTPLEQLLEQIATGKDDGLSEDEANARLRRYGLNELPKLSKRSELAILIEQFMSVPVGLLATSAVVSVATGGVLDAVVIMSVVAINAGIGFFTERQAEKTITSLTKTQTRYAHVMRGGKVQQVSHARVAPGDLLLLSPGDFVAADARLVRSHRLTVDESALTGESLPVVKSSHMRCDDKTPLADRLNMVHMGTMVTGGSGSAVVVATGAATELGKIQSMVGATRPPETPMQMQLEKIGTQLAVISSAVCASVFVIGLLRGQSFLQMLKSAISLAVAAVPEGLPTVATTTLALGIRNMQQHHVAIRRLNAVETLGSVQVFCLDKTGTLTLNKMTVVATHVGGRSIVISGAQFITDAEVIDPVGRADYLRFLQVLVLCNESETTQQGDAVVFDGSPTENALLELAINAGIDIDALRAQLPRLKIQYRSEIRPYMWTCHKLSDTTQLVAIKGSPLQVLDMCRFHYGDDGLQQLDDDAKARILAANDDMAGDALRVLGVAYAEQPLGNEDVYQDLVWLGLSGMIDPLRTGMPDLIHTFHQAGIQTVMITGDQSATAYAIGRQLGLNQDGSLQILDSTRLDKLDADLLRGVIDKVHVFARVSPAHKLQIVQALQQSGKVVAMTGDGINDGPALKASDIGVAMGGATTDVARSVSAVVLEDDNLHTMVDAIHQGRAIYNNIRKSVHYLISTNLSEIEVMLAGISLGFGQALNPMQLLWINLVSDIFPGLALSMEAPEPDLMRQAPRDPTEQIIRKQDLMRMFRESTIISAGAMTSYAYALLRYGPGPQANTHTFNTLTLAQLIHAYSCRSDHYSIFSKEKLPRNRYLSLAMGGSITLQLLAMSIPGLRSLLGASRLGLLDTVVVAGNAVLPLLINEAIKETAKRTNRPALTDQTGHRANHKTTRKKNRKTAGKRTRKSTDKTRDTTTKNTGPLPGQTMEDLS